MKWCILSNVHSRSGKTSVRSWSFIGTVETVTFQSEPFPAACKPNKDFLPRSSFSSLTKIE